MKKIRIAYHVVTGLLSAMLLASVIGMYFLNTADVQAAFGGLGYPEYLVIPLGIAKLLALVAIWSNLSPLLKQWAYAGLFFDFVLAAAAHLVTGDGQAGGAIGALVLLLASVILNSRLKLA